ncbi:hypothetical protein [Spirosoma jeollabukense]
MAQLSDQTDLQTDTYPLAQSTTSTKSGLNTVQKKRLGISAAAMLLGGAAWAVVQKIKEHSSKDGIPFEMPDVLKESFIQLPREIDVAGKVTDTMSFEEAFAAARSEVGMFGVFGWHGHWYNTFLKDEWNELSIQQRLDFTELVTHEQLPVKSYDPTTIIKSDVPTQTVPAPEPTIIEGYLNGQRVMGLDFDQDGIIDTLVMDGADGHTYRVVDATGDQGLDTVYRYDSLDGELTGVVQVDHAFVLSNDQFSQSLEESMSKEVVDSILTPDVSTQDASTPIPVIDTIEESHEADDEDTIYMADAHQPDDDTYVNNGDVHDMDE